MGGLTDVIESKILPLVGDAAPLLASVLGSPLAGVGISMLAKAFGVHSSNLDGLASALTGTPETAGAIAEKLQALELDNNEILLKLSSADYRTEVEDRENARANAVIFKDFIRHMAYLVTFGFFAALFCMFIPLTITPEEKNLLSMLVGMLASKWQTIIDFFFGSSHKQGGLK